MKLNSLGRPSKVVEIHRLCLHEHDLSDLRTINIVLIPRFMIKTCFHPDTLLSMHQIYVQVFLYDITLLLSMFCREIEITDFTYTVFKAFLQFFYTDEVDLPLKDAIGYMIIMLSSFFLY